MAVKLSPVGGVAGQFFDNSGNPLSGGKLYTYAAGTTTPVNTYTSTAGVTAHTNPIILDAGGRVPGGEIWFTDGLVYKLVQKTSADVLIGTYDNIIGINSNFINFLAQEEIQTATAGQTVFTLATVNYQPGTNSLSVFVDGVNQYDGSSYSYVETDGTTVTFTAGLHVGALVKFTTAQSLSSGATDASIVTYTPAGTGAVSTTVQAKLRESVSSTDFSTIQQAIDYATTLTPKGVVNIIGAYSLNSNINVTCDIDCSQGLLNATTGGKLTFATEYVKAKYLNIEVTATYSAQIIQVSVAHVTLVEPRINYTVNDTPLHTAINCAPPNTNGLWDVKIVRPYIRGCYQGIKLETSGGGTDGWITDVNISDATIISFALYAIRFNDAGAKGINYCSVNTLALENYGVSSLLKYGIGCEGTIFGNSFTDIKDFNDDPLLGTYYTIYCVDAALDTLATGTGGPTLANHIMQFTRNVFSNCRIEGTIFLGKLRNLYTLKDVHVYNKVSILALDGYDYYHDYGPDAINYQIDLATVTLNIVNPANATLEAAQNRLKVFMNGNSTAQLRFVMPPWLIASANAAGYCTIAFATDFYSQVPTTNFAIRTAAGNVPIDSTVPSTNMRTDKRLVVLTYNLSGITLVTGDYICIDFTGVAPEVYSVNSIFAYAGLANPVLDSTPFVNAVY